jgi:putative oxidoreductase
VVGLVARRRTVKLRTRDRAEGLRSLATSPGSSQQRLEIARVITRIALAWIFVYHGSGTLFNTFQGPGLHAGAHFYATTAHLHPGMFFAVLSGSIEFFGGLAIGVGLLGRLAALGLIGEMVMAMITVTFPHGLESSGLGQGYEINIALAALCVFIVLVGTGRYSLGAVIHRSLENRR